ncbi:MAG TPA: carboxypeptidase-like regulatory domain-containing protein [Pyrinomonadaceae bacterium]
MNNLTETFHTFLQHQTLSCFIRKRLTLFLCLLAFTAIIVTAQDAQTASAAEARAGKASDAGGSITGRITTEDGQPLVYATVYLSRAFLPGLGQQLSVSTDEDGKFQAANLLPGLYSVSAYAPGLISQPNTIPSTGEARYYRVGDTVNLTLSKGGVITGTVRDANGEPLVAIPVKLVRVRDANGRPVTNGFSAGQFRLTDDRGIYRLYGLTPGTYLVGAGGATSFFIGSNTYDSDIPTYYPSSTRDTAAEVSLRGGEEVTNIDIRYRGERGHTISGTITGLSTDSTITYGINLILRQASNNAYELSTFVSPSGKAVFSLQGIADGVYMLTAQQGSSSGNTLASTPRRVVVKGADVTGLELTLAPLGSIAGRATLELLPKKEGCEASARPALLIETLINARRAEKSQADNLLTTLFAGSASALTDAGEFTIRNLGAGSYRLIPHLPTDFWYVHSIVLPNTTQRAATPSAAKTAETKSAATLSLINLKGGENFAGVTVNIAQDGAVVRGRVTAAKEGEGGLALPANLKVYLVPMERERAEDLLRYAEVKPNDDGTFGFTNVAPGRYWLIALPFVEDDSPERIARPLAWDADARAKLRRDAEAQNTTVELQPCKSVTDKILRYPITK